MVRGKKVVWRRGVALVVQLQGVDMVRGRRAWWFEVRVQIGERLSSYKEDR